MSKSIFQLAYGSVYFLLYLVLLGLLLITPTDIIERSIRHRQNNNVWLLIIAYVGTIIIVVFIYFIRLYVNRTDLANIPKGWVPIDVGDVNKHVHKIINAGLDRSAAISYQARPLEADSPTSAATTDDLGISNTVQAVLWSSIEHYGWASPNSHDLPNLQYSTVLSELPNLIEAKALTLAPYDPTAQSGVPTIDADAAALLHRPANLGLRGYIDHLVTLCVLNHDETTTIFLQQYEYSRFSTRPLSNAQFRELMHLFAQVLRAMEPLDLSILEDEVVVGSSFVSEYHHAEDSPTTPRGTLASSPTMSTQGSVRRPLTRSTSQGTQQQRRQYHEQGHPMTPGSRSGLSTKMSSSNLSVHYAQSVSSSLRSRSSGSGSVIRLATHDDDEEMPYVLNLRGTSESLGR